MENTNKMCFFQRVAHVPTKTLIEATVFFGILLGEENGLLSNDP